MMSSRVSQVATPDPIPLIQYRRFRRSLSSHAPFSELNTALRSHKSPEPSLRRSSGR